MIEKGRVDRLLSEITEESGVAYIFKQEAYTDAEISDEGIILWNMGQWGQYIIQIMEKNYTKRKKCGCFYHITGKYGPTLSSGKKYLMFYPSSEANREEDKVIRCYQHFSSAIVKKEAL